MTRPAALHALANATRAPQGAFSAIAGTNPYTSALQASEAAAFTLTAQPGRPSLNTTGDLFGFDADDLIHWQADQSRRRRSKANADDVADLFD